MSYNHQNYQSFAHHWQLPNGLQALSRHSPSKKQILTKKTYQTTVPSPVFPFYPS